MARSNSLLYMRYLRSEHREQLCVDDNTRIHMKHTMKPDCATSLQVMQIYPTELSGRMQLHDYQLHAGKATLVSQGHASCQYQTEISLLDVFELPMSTT